jgi:hypothetical protein
MHTRVTAIQDEPCVEEALLHANHDKSKQGKRQSENEVETRPKKTTCADPDVLQASFAHGHNAKRSAENNVP